MVALPAHVAFTLCGVSVPQLTELVNLDENVRLQRIYAQGNKLRTLVGSSLPLFKFLRELDVSNNNISNLTETLSVLSRFQFLEDLGKCRRLAVESVPACSQRGVRSP